MLEVFAGGHVEVSGAWRRIVLLQIGHLLEVTEESRKIGKQVRKRAIKGKKLVKIKYIRESVLVP